MSEFRVGVKQYTDPSVDVVKFDDRDVVCTSTHHSTIVDNDPNTQGPGVDENPSDDEGR